MSAEITSTGTFKTIATAGETAPTNEGQSIHERNIGNGELDPVAGLQNDTMGFSEVKGFIALFAAANSLDGPTAIVRLKHMLIELERVGVTTRVAS